MTNAHADVLLMCSTNEIVGFCATRPFHGARLELGARTKAESRPTRQEHRVVILPAWQGIGLGPMLSNTHASTWAVRTAVGYWSYLIHT